MSLCEATPEQKAKYLERLPYAEVFGDNILAGVLMSKEKCLEVKDMEMGPDDVIVASYPKSGTTWVSEVVSAIAFGGDVDILKSIRMDERVPWLEFDEEKIKAAVPESVLNTAPNVDLSKAKKRVFFSHATPDFLPKSVREGRTKVVYVARNPKDNAVSYFHFHQMAKHFGNQMDLTWKEFFPIFCSGFVPAGSWFKHVPAYWKFAQTHPNVKFVVYEDMKKDLGAVMGELEQFIGVPLTKEQRAKVVEHCSFGSMKDNKMTNRDGLSLFDDKGPKFMRKGIVGDWKNYFTVAQNEEFDELYKQKLEGSGLKFEFE